MKSSLLLVAVAFSILLAGMLAWQVDTSLAAAPEVIEPETVSAVEPSPVDSTTVDTRLPDSLLDAPPRSGQRSLAVMPQPVDLTGGLRAARRPVGVAGTIREARTRHMIDAHVSFVRSGEESQTVRSTGGKYVVAALTPGAWRISAHAPGYAAWSAEVLIEDRPAVQTVEIELDRNPHLKVRFETPAGVELGQALREEPALKKKFDVIAVATSAPPGDRLGTTLEDTYTSFDKGTWRPTPRTDYDRDDVEPEYSGVLELAAPLPGWVNACVANTVLRSRYVQRNTDAITFVISLDELRGNLGALRLRIVDADSGEPLSDGRVGLHANGKFGMGDDITDPNGWVVFDGEAPGPRHLSIVVRGHEWVVEQVWIEAGRVTDLGTYRLNKLVSIRGRLVDQAGNPVKAWVSVYPLDRYDATSRILDKFCWTSNPAGNFEVRPIGRRPYLLRVNDETWSAEPVLVDASSGPIDEVEMVLVRGTPITFLFEASTPRGARLAVFDFGGRPIAERPIDAAKRAKIRLAPGGYRALIELGEQRLAERTIEVGTVPRDEFF